MPYNINNLCYCFLEIKSLVANSRNVSVFFTLTKHNNPKENVSDPILLF